MRDSEPKHVKTLHAAVKGIADAGIRPVPLDVIVALARAIVPHTMRLTFKDDEAVLADIMFDDGTGGRFCK